MNSIWMIRAGSRGAHLDVFENGQVAIGYDVNQDLSRLRDLGAIKAAYLEANAGASKIEVAVAAGVMEKFVRVIKEGDHVITYDPGRREYLSAQSLAPISISLMMTRRCLTAAG